MSAFRHLNFKSLKINIMALLIVHISLISLNTEYVHNYARIVLICEILFLVLFVPHIKVLLRKENQIFNLILCLFCISMFLSSYLNRDYVSSDLMKTFRYVLGIFETFLFFEYLNVTGKCNKGLKTIYYTLFIYAALSDVLSFTMPHIFMPSFDYQWNGYEYYNVGRGANVFLVGNKFLLSYLHMLVFILYYYFYNQMPLIIKKKKKIILLAHWIWAVVAAIYSECTTALVGCIVLFIIIFFIKKFYVLAHRMGFLLSCIAICDSFFVYSAAILNLAPVRHVIEQILYESTDLTGRIYIYAQMGSMVLKKFWFGYGYENNYRACINMMGYDNAQNGIFDNLVSFGFVGTALLVVLLCMALKKSKMNQNAFVYLIYIYILLSAVEVTMNLKFVVAIALLAFAWNNSQEDNSNIGAMKGKSLYEQN